MTRKRFSFDIESPCNLGVAVHAYMCESATLTPEQAINLATHDRMEEHDQLMAYGAGAGLDTVTIIGDSHIGEPCKYLGADYGVGRDVIVVLGGDLMQHDRRLIALEPRMFKMEPRMLREIEPPAVVPRKGTRKRDWEQRNRKQKRR